MRGMEREGTYVLDGTTPVAAEPDAWERFMLTADRRLIVSELHGAHRRLVIETWFLGTAVYGPGDAGPFFFGLIVRTNGVPGRCRYSPTWSAAVVAHREVMTGLKARSAGVGEPPPVPETSPLQQWTKLGLNALRSWWR